MSLEMHAFVEKDRLPARAAWQAAIEQLRYPLRLDPELDLSTASGFSPCILDGNESGFDLYLDRVAEIAEAYPHIRDRISRCTWAVSFRWGGDLRECACVSAAAAALIQCAGALVYYPEDDLWYGAEELRKDFEACVSE